MKRTFKPPWDKFGKKSLNKRIISLIRVIRGYDEYERDKAGRELVKIGEPAVPWMVGLLTHEDVRLRGPAVQILGVIGGKRAIAALFGAMDDEDKEVRGYAVDYLAHIGRPALPFLIKALSAEDFDKQQNAAKALEKMGKPAIPGLIKALKDEKIRDDVVDLLGKIGRPAVPQLIKAMKDKDRRSPAAIALGIIGDPKGVPALTRALKEKDSTLVMNAMEALEKIARKNPYNAEVRKAQPLLIRLLGNKDIDMRYVAANALSVIGTKAALPALRKLQKGDPISTVRNAAKDAMNKILKRGIIRRKKPNKVEVIIRRKRGRLV
jgi:HEAT repeat protein